MSLEWMSSAACTETDPDSFFPEAGQSTRPAKSVCEVCPVAAQCLEYALANNFTDGIYGGVAARDRRMLKRRPNGRPRRSVA